MNVKESDGKGANVETKSSNSCGFQMAQSWVKNLSFFLVHLKTRQRGKIISSSCFTMKRVTATTEENNDIIYKHNICNLQHFSSWVVAYKTRMIPEFEKPREHFHGEDKQT